ncbi:MAG: DUF4197 domain-containing protein [Spirochaetales bacterium]|nr:DUF4197 domain-containing protein [Spirochaetales bacterium]
MKKPIIALFAASLLLVSCLETMQSSLSGALRTGNSRGGGLDESTVIAGLKEALRIGTQNAVNLVGKTDGYFRNARIALPLPDDLKNVGDTLRRIGLGRKVDEFIRTMNRAAEEAAPKAVDIFVDAVTKMTVQDAMGILRGTDNAATDYFERKTRSALHSIFLPIVKQVLEQVGVTSLYQSLLRTYNAIPGMRRVTFDLNVYVTDKALDGLFLMLADEEKKIRKDPAARVTDLLRRVFG